MGRGKARPGSGHRVQRSGYKSKLHQESERARPSERLRQEGKKRSAQGQTRAERSAVKAEKVKLRMGAAQEKLAAQAPVKPPRSGEARGRGPGLGRSRLRPRQGVRGGA